MPGIAANRTVHLLCNSHLDPVWLWEWPEGAGQALALARTVCDLCEEFDGFVFNRNEVQFYEWIEEYDSSLFGRIGDGGFPESPLRGAQEHRPVGDEGLAADFLDQFGDDPDGLRIRGRRIGTAAVDGGLQQDRFARLDEPQSTGQCDGSSEGLPLARKVAGSNHRDPALRGRRGSVGQAVTLREGTDHPRLLRGVGTAVSREAVSQPQHGDAREGELQEASAVDGV